MVNTNNCLKYHNNILT